MKKLFAILLTVAMLASMAIVASAASTTTLTTTVPAATYTLNIPADTEIEFGKTFTSLGNLTVTNQTGFAVGKNLKVTITYTDFSCENISTTIPMTISAHYKDNYGSNTIASGDSLLFRGLFSGELSLPEDESYNDLQYLGVEIDSKDWGKALAGEYTATITFTAEVVAG